MFTMFGAILCAVEAMVMGFIIYGITGMMENDRDEVNATFDEELCF